MSLIKLIEFKNLADERGGMVALESNRSVPFEVKRVYYLFGSSPGVSRGFHAHRSLQQVAICVHGSCRMVLDDGVRREEVRLGSPCTGLMIGDRVWREIHDFSPDCVLLVLASAHYDESDYIRSYDDFVSEIAT